jgi:hypothetical protein
MDDKSILDRIHQLVESEHTLRHTVTGLSNDDRRRLESIEHQLDQAWDLLRQRRAREELGEDPNQASERSVDAVDGYLQ